MKNICLIILIFWPMLSIGQKNYEQIYLGGSRNLNNELSKYFAENDSPLIDDTAHIFFIKITAKKKANSLNEKLTFQVFGKDTSLKNLLLNFLISHKHKWNYRKLKKAGALLPIFIASYRTDFKKIFVNWANIPVEDLPESQLVHFIKPIVIQLYCCPSHPSKDF